MKIFHTSDIHLGDFPGPDVNNENGRARNIKNVLDRLILEAKNQSPDVVVITGDLFHQAKTWCDRALSEVKTIQSALYQFADIPSVKAVVAIKGTANHDGKEHFDMLKEITRFNPLIHIVNDETADAPSYIEVANLCQFICVPAFDKTAFENDVSKIYENADAIVRNKMASDILHQKIRAGLKLANNLTPVVLATHFTVLGCKNENGFTNVKLLEPVIDPSSLEGYDLVCLGHIHKPQKAADNAFYAGAPLQLTFGDEGQERGYYVHKFDGNKFISEFHAIPSPIKFFTLRLDNRQIEKLIASDYDATLLDDLTDYITRVFYSCDADVQKNLNKALLEKALLQAGAWSVDGITSDDIIVKTNKNVVNVVETPFDILSDWLKSQDSNVLQNIDINACLTLAKPLIDKIAANTSQITSSGLFTPIRIIVKNYRNYADAEFCYDDVKFCVINGKNGAGKSSLFMDAMFDAMFEDPRENDIRGWINNRAEVQSGAITFEFSLGVKTYKIIRTRTKSGKTTLNVYSLGDDGSWIDLSKSNTRDTQALIEQIISVDAFTLKSCGLIMQADYGAFLQADKSARMAVLSDILGLSFYERLHSEVVSESAEITHEVTKLQTEKETILSETPDTTDVTDELNVLKENEKTRADSKKNYGEFKAKTLNDVKNVEAILGQIKQLNAAVRDLSYSLDDKTKTSEELAKEYVETTQTLASEAKIEQNYAKYTALKEQESLFAHRESFKNMHILTKTGAEKDLAKVEKTIEDVKTKIAALERECSEEIIAKLQTDVLEFNQAEAELNEIISKENEYQNLATAHKARFEKFQTHYAVYETNAKALHDSIDRLRNEIARLENSGCLNYEKANCEFIKAAKTAPAKIAKLQKELEEEQKKYRAETAASQAETDSYEAQMRIIADYLNQKSEIKNALTEKLPLLREASTALVKAESSKQTLVQHIAQINSENSHKQCLEAMIKDAQNALDEITRSPEWVDNTSLEEIRASILALEPEVEIWRQLPALKEKFKNASDLLSKINAEIDELKREITSKQELLRNLFTLEAPNEQAHENNLRALQESLSNIDDYVRQLDEDLLAIAKRQGVLEEKLKRAKENQTRVDEISDKLSDFTKLDACYDLLKLAFSKNGITHNIIRRVIPELEETASQILGAMTGNALSVKFILDKTLKSKKEIITLDVAINDDGPSGTGSLPYLSRSGGEKVKSALAVILALAELKASQNGAQLGFLFIDEPPFLDSDGVNAYCDALDVIYSRYPDLKIMAITHDEEMKTRFPQNISVYKDDAGSRFISTL